jgi:hypothetical protein
VAGAFNGVLLDNDTLSLLAAAGLLADTLDIYGFKISQAYRLESLPHMLRRGQIGKQWPPSARSRAASEAAGVQVWDHEPDAVLFDRFTGVIGIDAGEALFYASLVERPNMLMMSGDKTAMKALVQAADLRDVRDAVAGRIVCLEEILDALVVAHGAQAIGEACAELRSHQTLRIVFTETTMTDDGQCRENIASYYRELMVAVGADFLYGGRNTAR